MNFSRLAAAGFATIVLGAALPSVAAATDYCVTPNMNCGQNNVGTFQDALDKAASVDDPDRIFLGADTYGPPPGQDGFVYPASNAPVEIIGSGRGQTTLTGREFGVEGVLDLFGGPGSSVHDLTIQIPRNVAANFTGLLTINTAQRVDVTEDTVQANPHQGAMLFQGGVMEDSNVKLESPQKTTAVLLGVPVQGTPPTLRGSTVSAATGVRIDGGGTIERSRVIGTNAAVVAAGNHSTIRDSFLTITGSFGTVLRANAAPNADTNVTADGLTIFASDMPDIGGVAVSTGPAPSSNVHLTLTNSIVRGGFDPLSAFAGGPGTGTISASYSDYDPSGNIEFGGSAKISESNVSNVGVIGFSEETGREFALLPGSPLIDAGDPAAPQGVDMHGDPRVADGNGDGVARRDLGAFELQPAPAAGPSGGGGPGGGPAADTQAPLISGFRSSRSVFAIARAGTPVAARVAQGTRLRYTLSEGARVTMKIQRRLAGRPARYRAVGRLKRSGVSGLNRTRFTGRIGRRALRPGRYRVVITATDAAGNRSAPKSARFRIARG
jgi:hypothetical protein